MANKEPYVLIRELPEKPSAHDEDVMVVEDSNTTYKISFAKTISSIKEKIKDTFITLTQKGAPNGVAPLNDNKKIDAEYLIFGTTENTIYDGAAGKANETAILDHAENIDNPHKVTKEQVGLSEVENKSVSTILGELTKDNVTTALGYTPEEEGALTSAKAYTDQEIANLIGGADSTLDTLKEISDAMADEASVIEALNAAIGEKANGTDLQAHIADENLHVTADLKANIQTAYDYSQVSHARTDATRTVASTINGYINVNGTDSLVYQHPSSTVTPGTYKRVTVDADGHVLSGSNPITGIDEGGTGATNGADAIANFGVTATLEELNTLSGITVSAGELNYNKGLTGNVQTQLDGKAEESHGVHVPDLDGVGKYLVSGENAPEWHSLTKDDIANALGFMPGEGTVVKVAVKGDAEEEYRTGYVNLTPANLGLGNVDNTADSNKAVYSATKLTTARKIANATFDGSRDITAAELGITDVFSQTEPVGQAVNTYWVQKIE